MPVVATASTPHNWQCAQPFERRHTHLPSAFPVGTVHSLVQCLSSGDNTLTCPVSFQRGQYTHLPSVFPARTIHSLVQCLSSEDNTLTCQVSFQRGQYTHLPSVFPASALSASISVPSPANAAKCGSQCRKFSCRCFSAP